MITDYRAFIDGMSVKELKTFTDAVGETEYVKAFAKNAGHSKPIKLDYIAAAVNYLTITQYVSDGGETRTERKRFKRALRKLVRSKTYAPTN